MHFIIQSSWLALALICASLITHAQSVRITSIGIDEDGRIKILVDGPAGEYQIESTTDLSSDENWGPLCRRGSEGSGMEISEAIDSDNPVQFYRIKLYPTADGFHITGEFAQELESELTFSNLQTTFGLNFIQAEALIPATDALSWGARNARAYAATIAALSKLSQDIRDSFAPGSEPTTAQIVAALSADLSDGQLDGKDDASDIFIGTTGETLLAHSDSDIISRLAQIQADMPGLDNIVFTDNGSGSYTAKIPSTWGTSYWDSSDWQ